VTPACVEELTIPDSMLKAANQLSKMPREYRNHKGSYEGVRSTLSRARWQIFWMVSLGGGIIATFVYLSMAAD
jgi:hypothetical protein